MLIGSRFAMNKMYRGIKFYDSLPLTSGDLHEYADILHMKNKLFMDSIVGSGVLNEPGLTISSTGISLLSPSILLLDGDISLIQSDSNILSINDITSSGVTNGVLCVVGWYQLLTASSTLRSYGGVNNSTLENDILDDKLMMQVSTRYQFRWDTVIIDRNLFYSSEESITFTLKNRESTGELTSGTTQITTSSNLGGVRVALKPSIMDYAVSDLYIVPILEYEYSNSVISSASPSKSISPNTSVKTSLQEYRNTISIGRDISSPTDIDVNIGISEYTEDSILHVTYENLLLNEGEHYTISSDRTYITLKEFTTLPEEQITFIVIKS